MGSRRRFTREYNQEAGVDSETGGVDTYLTVMGIPVTLSLSGCTVPVGVNTIVITEEKRGSECPSLRQFQHAGSGNSL